MTNSINGLIAAIVSYITEGDGYVTKTKLLKLLYLFDVEYYRVHRTTFTGFQWKYFHLGPWTGEFDPIVNELVDQDVLIETPSSNPDYDTKFYKTAEPVGLEQVFPAIRDEAILKKILDTWLDSSTGEILDHVYFRTEPMEHGIRNEALDFTKILPETVPRYSRASSTPNPKQLKALRKKFEERIVEIKATSRQFTFTPPRYDDEYLKAIEKLDRGG